MKPTISFTPAASTAASISSPHLLPYLACLSAGGGKIPLSPCSTKHGRAPRAGRRTFVRDTPHGLKPGGFSPCSELLAGCPPELRGLAEASPRYLGCPKLT